MSLKIGAAPVIPETKAWFMGVPSLFPTQVETKYWGVKPNVQLSFRSLVVPVLALTIWWGITNLELGPNSIVRALLSCKICETKYAGARLITRDTSFSCGIDSSLVKSCKFWRRLSKFVSSKTVPL